MVAALRRSDGNIVALAVWCAVTAFVAANCDSKTKPASTSLAGVVTDSVTAATIAGATVVVQGKTTTTGNDGKYSITGLTDGPAAVTTQHQGHINVSKDITLSSATTLDVAMTPSTAAKLAGNWTGTWKNATFSTQGTETMTIAVDTVAQTMNITLDVNGSVFGGADPAPETLTTTYTLTGATFSKSSPVFGNLTLTISPAGTLSGAATSVPTAGISRVDFTGTITPTLITVNYAVTFTNTTIATGTATFGK
jgi:hypothetical protein